jgi:phospholipase A-2-activating protein
VEGEGTGTSKKIHEGQEYDYVFDIDIEDGKPPLKLPYNLTESSWDAARKFLERNELPLSYYEQVANWIVENTQGARIGQGSGQSNQSAPPQGHDPWGTERRYRPGDAPSSSAPRKLPQRSYIGIVEGNPTNAINIISQKNESGDLPTEQRLSPEETAALSALPAQLQNKQDPKPTPEQVNALIKVASRWPTKSRVPAVGVLAVLAVSPESVSATSASGQTVVDIITAAGLLQPSQETPNNVVHAIRLLVNLFKSAPGTKTVHENFEQVLRLVRPFASEPESPAQVKALATLYLNYAVLLSSTKLATDREARAKVLDTDIAVLLESDSPHATDADALFRTLSALGTLLFVSDTFKQSLKGGISGTLHFASAKPAAQLPDTKELIQEIRDQLR